MPLPDLIRRINTKAELRVQLRHGCYHSMLRMRGYVCLPGCFHMFPNTYVFCAF